MICRIGGAALAATWIVLLFRPVFVTAIEGSGLHSDQITPDMLQYEPGYSAALVGWLFALQPGPVFAWFANPLGLWCLIDLMRGRSPNLVAAVAALFLAFTGLQPIHLTWFDDHGVNGPAIPLAAAHVWAWSFVIPVAVLILIHGFRLPPEPKELLAKEPRPKSGRHKPEA